MNNVLKKLVIAMGVPLLAILPFANVAHAGGVFITATSAPVYYPTPYYAPPPAPYAPPPAPYYYTTPAPVVYSAPAVYAAPVVVAPAYYGWGYHHHWHY